MIEIQLDISEQEQMDSYTNSALHGAPGGHTVSIDAEAPIPEQMKTQDEIKAYLEEQLESLSRQGWRFNIYIGPESDN